MQKVKTIKEYERDRNKCTYCGGTGVDILDKTKPCPNCTLDVVTVMTDEEKEELINEKIKEEMNDPINN